MGGGSKFSGQWAGQWCVGLITLLSSLETGKRVDRSSLGSCLEEVGRGRKDGVSLFHQLSLVLSWSGRWEGLSGGATFLLMALAVLAVPQAKGAWMSAHETLQQPREAIPLAPTRQMSKPGMVLGLEAGTLCHPPCLCSGLIPPPT